MNRLAVSTCLLLLAVSSAHAAVTNDDAPIGNYRPCFHRKPHTITWHVSERSVPPMSDDERRVLAWAKRNPEKAMTARIHILLSRLGANR